MRVETCETAARASTRVAEIIAEQLRIAITERGYATLALSGGHTPVAMFRQLATQSVDWSRIHIFQVDERIVHASDNQRNAQTIRSGLVDANITEQQFHRMPVGTMSAEAGITSYRQLLFDIAGEPPVLDVIHLGLGEDGHTASLFRDDEAIDADDEVAVTGVCNGLRRLTLTLKVLNRARFRVWLITGVAKRHVVTRLLDRDPDIVASRVRDDNSILVLDLDATRNRA
jgi:6-phosphogluconolactonase